MKIFISWSGDRSRAVARALREFIPTVFQAVEVYTSIDDVQVGQRWSSETARLLQDIDVGLLCVTADNMRSPWLAFEAGTLLSKQTHLLFPVLVDLSPAQLPPPLAYFQAWTLSRSDTYQLFRLLNNRLQKPLSDEVFERLFQHLWPAFERQLEVLPEATVPDQNAHSLPTPLRSDREILEEVLEVVRRIQAELSRGREGGSNTSTGDA